MEQPEYGCALPAKECSGQCQSVFCGFDKLVEGNTTIGGFGLELVAVMD
jgi:hypothetical protein